MICLATLLEKPIEDSVTNLVCGSGITAVSAE